MRATWVVLGALLVGGGAAYWHLRWNGGADERGAAAPRQRTPAGPALEHNVPIPLRPRSRPTPLDPDEVLAVRLLQDDGRGEGGRRRRAPWRPR